VGVPGVWSHDRRTAAILVRAKSGEPARLSAGDVTDAPPLPAKAWQGALSPQIEEDPYAF